MRKFENQVQLIKHELLTEVAKHAFNGTLDANIDQIPITVNPGPDEKYRCCIFHERAITVDRIKMVLGGNPDIKGIVEVLDSACDQCPVDRYIVTEACRGCLAHRCENACPVDAVSICKGKAIIDYHKCVECGKCKSICPYNAIADVMRPCRRDCPTNAITIDYRKKAVINYDECISCGACVYSCPFGAMQEKSEIVDVIKALLMPSESVYAMLAPAFSAQFNYVPLGNVITGLKQLGFRDVIEVALGADMIVQHEAEELIHFKHNNKTLTSSCCPSFVEFIHKKFPELVDNISKTVSPMTATARLIKLIDPSAKVVFIGPCIGKKLEKNKVQDTDYVLTFEELAALIDAKAIDLNALTQQPLDNASYFGRKFASTGGVSSAVKHHLEEHGLTDLSTECCDGIEACSKTLLRLKHKKVSIDFIEGMACQGGCIKGPATMHHGPKDLKALEDYAKSALEATSKDALRVFETSNISLI